MTSYSWIKLYHEILHDPKMGRLTDNLWRRVIEIFLLAGENGGDGHLPPIEDMAWTLRLSIEELESNLMTLEKYDIVSSTPQGWFVTHYEKRQAPVDVKDRVSAYRDRIKKHDYYGDETDEKQQSNESVTSRYTDTDTDKSKRKNKKKSNGAEKAPRQRDPLFDAIAKVTCTDPITAGPSIGKIESTLKKANPPYTPDEVLEFGNDWPDWKDKPPTLWQLKEQIGIVRQNGRSRNGKKVKPDKIIKQVTPDYLETLKQQQDRLANTPGTAAYRMAHQDEAEE